MTGLIDALLFFIFLTGATVWIVVAVLGLIRLIEILDKGSKK